MLRAWTTGAAGHRSSRQHPWKAGTWTSCRTGLLAREASTERLLVYLHVDGQDFNARLVSEGYARVYEEGESRRKGDYLLLQHEAQVEGLGLWSCRP